MAPGFIFGFGEDERCRIAKDFLSDPDAFLTASGKTFGTIQCPQSCHDALARGQAAADDAEQIGGISLLTCTRLES